MIEDHEDRIMIQITGLPGPTIPLLEKVMQVEEEEEGMEVEEDTKGVATEEVGEEDIINKISINISNNRNTIDH
jgi:hypothetical protein